MMEELKLQPELLVFLKKIADKQGLEKYSIADVQTNAKGEGYLGIIWMITLKDEATDKLFNFIIKSAFTDDHIRNAMPIRTSFENEVFFYTKIVPAYKNLSPNFVFTPAFFDSSLTEHAEMLAMENLKTSGFEIFSKYSVLDHDHVKLIFETYGKFHACSFALKQIYPEKFKEISGKTNNVFDQFKDSGMEQFWMKGTDLIKKSLVPGKDDEIIDKFRKYEGKNILNVFGEAYSESKFSTILHGDCWSNNMLFKYQKLDNSVRKPTELRLIDFQLTKSGSPACDLSYFFYSGGSKPVFDKLEEYLQIYYQNFSSFLSQLGGDPVKAFTFDDVKEEWKRFAKFGFILSIGVWQLKFTPSDQVKDLTDIPKDSKEYKIGEIDEEGYVIAVREVIDNMLKFEAL